MQAVFYILFSFALVFAGGILTGAIRVKGIRLQPTRDYVEYLANRRRYRQWRLERDCETNLHRWSKWRITGYYYVVQQRRCKSCGMTDRYQLVDKPKAYDEKSLNRQRDKL